MTFGVVAAANLVPFGLRWVRRRSVAARWAIRRVPLSRIRDAPEGTVHLRGRVLCDEPLLEAPLSRRRCVFHEVIVDRLGRITFGPFLHQVRGLGFRVEDETGMVYVTFQDVGPAPMLAAGPRFIECGIRGDVRERSGTFRGTAPRLAALLAEHDRNASNWFFSPRLVATEGVIQVGDVVDLVGRGARRAAPGGESTGYRSPPEEYVVEAAEDAPLILVKRANHV